VVGVLARAESGKIDGMAITDVRAAIPESAGLDELRELAGGCQGCELYKRGTQTVFGEGAHQADIMFVGEQPGDQEDKQGHPFVGPAGRLLHEALEDAGFEGSSYITNVVKHFKWVARGKRRIHKKPNLSEVRACRPWLEAEIDAVRPQAIVCLGATAAQALLGPQFRVTKQRGEFVESPLAPFVMATIHPSAILRADEGDRDTERAAFVADLTGVARALGTASS
jgi:uracil-DNA glycosylase family protein